MTVYLYGIVRAPLDLPHMTGVGEAEIRTITRDSVAAVVSSAGEGPLRATAAGLRAHTRVLDSLAEHTTVLPLRFGMVVTDDDAVADLLEPNAAQLDELLQGLDGHVQLTVKALTDEEQALRDVVRTDARVARLWRRVQGIPADAAYYDRINLGQEIARALRERRDAAARPLFERLAPLSTDAVFKEPAQELMVLDADFLVPRKKVAAFDEGVDTLAKAHPELQFRYVGPLPVYSFSDLVLEGA